MGYGPTPTSAAGRAHVASARAALPPERERPQWRASALHAKLTSPSEVSLSREKAQHARLRRARDRPRWLRSDHTLRKPTAPAGRPLPPVHGRAPTCELRPLNEKLNRACAQVKKRKPRALSRSLSGGGAARTLASTRAPSHWLESGHTLWKPTAPAKRPSPLVHGRASTCEPRPPNENLTRAWAQVKKHKPRALALSLRRRRCTHACDVRAPRCASGTRSMRY